MGIREEVAKRCKSALTTPDCKSRYEYGKKPRMEDLPPISTDCSGFSKWGLWPHYLLPDGAFNQIKHGPPVSGLMAEKHAGILGFTWGWRKQDDGSSKWMPVHVGVTDGNGYVIEALNPKLGIRCIRKCSSKAWHEWRDPLSIKDPIPQEAGPAAKPESAEDKAMAQALAESGGAVPEGEEINATVRSDPSLSEKAEAEKRKTLNLFIRNSPIVIGTLQLNPQGVIQQGSSLSTGPDPSKTSWKIIAPGPDAPISKEEPANLSSEIGPEQDSFGYAMAIVLLISEGAFGWPIKL